MVARPEMVHWIHLRNNDVSNLADICSVTFGKKLALTLALLQMTSTKVYCNVSPFSDDVVMVDSKM